MEKRTKASVSHKNGVILGVSDVIRWGDIMNVQGHDMSVSKAVELGLKYKIEIAAKLEKDLKSDTGLLVTFPVMYLMDELQRKVGSGEELLELVKA